MILESKALKPKCDQPNLLDENISVKLKPLLLVQEWLGRSFGAKHTRRAAKAKNSSSHKKLVGTWNCLITGQEQSLKWIERERYSWETLSHLINCYIVRQICKILPWTAQFHTKSVLGFKLGPQMTLRRPNWSVRGLKQHWSSTLINVILTLIFGWKLMLT